MRVILVYDELVRCAPVKAAPEDLGAEYEDQRTIESILQAIRANGHDAEGLVLGEDFPAQIRRLAPDLVFNIAEGISGPTRESIVPAWLDQLKIPYTGSDGLALAISLDKAQTKMLAAARGVSTPAFRRVRHLAELDALDLKFPLFVKPNAEGSSMGIRRASRVQTEAQLRRQIEWVLQNYPGDCLIEEFVPGREFCVGILGDREPTLLPIAEIRCAEGFYSYEYKHRHDKELICPADLRQETVDEMNRIGLEVYRALGCRDFARVDLKLDGAGRPQFLEINPLPGLSPYYSVFTVQAQAAGISHAELIGRIVGYAMERVPVRKEVLRTTTDWDDWRWQLANRIATVDALETYIELTAEERAGIEAASRCFAWSITPYYASLMDRTDPRCPIRMQALPSIEELYDEAGQADPLLEEKHQPVDLVIRVYPDRVAFCVGNRCPVYCRHCLRKETMVGKPDVDFSDKKIAQGIEYIRHHPEIRDVLLTGGDPLLLPDDRLEEILARLHEIPSVEVIRIGSRTPCTLPQRITPELCRMLEKYHPLYLNTQFNHPREITAEAERACGRLASAGIPLGNQSVLLRGINDDPETMKTLCRELMRIRVRPYYVYQCQTLTGTRHFRVPIERGQEIIRSLQGYTSGLAVPRYILDTPYGKIPLMPSYVVGREGDNVVMQSYDGKIWREHNPLNECLTTQNESKSVRCNISSCSCSCTCKEDG